MAAGGPGPEPACRFCGGSALLPILSLGQMPPANRFLTDAELRAGGEPKFPLDLYFCQACGLVQIGHALSPEMLFKDYIYRSSTSEAVHRHADYLADSNRIRFGLSARSLVVEVASNDGCILRAFKKTGVRTVGVEPAANIAKEANAAGIETVPEFFNEKTALRLREEYGGADLILARHVFAHVPDIHDFVRGLRGLSAGGGIIVVEAPYLVDFIEKTEFDTVYHEHYSYLSLRPMVRLFESHGLEVFDAERVSMHGGSLIYFIGEKGRRPIAPAVDELIRAERAMGLDTPKPYAAFAERALALKESLRGLLARLHAEGRRVAAYGAPAKGNTLLNFCGITPEWVSYTVDRSPDKQNLFTPGAHIPVRSTDVLIRDRPDYVLLLAWNFADEILEQQAEYRRRGGQFIIPIPAVRIV